VAPNICARVPALFEVCEMKPLVLLITAQRWLSTARIGMAFAEAGWTVEAVCPYRHIFGFTKAVRRLHHFDFLAIPQSIRRAISKARPDLVIPCDDLVAGHLRHLCDSDSSSNGSDELRALLARSLGDSSCYADLDSRSRIATLAKDQGVAVPETVVVRSDADLEACLVRNDLPVVLKVDGSSGGSGVRIVRNLEEARSAFATLSIPVGFLTAVKRAVVDRNGTYVMPALKRNRPVVNLQRYVAGEEVTCTAACWQGEVLACTALRVLNTSGRFGGSTVVQVIDDPNVLHAVQTMSRRLRISGLYGFDFILERESGQPFLLEINPRATPTTHLRTSAGSLAFALRFALTGEGAKPVSLYKTGDIIALFPQEWHRDQESDFLRTAYHDTPWNEPEFVRACLRREKGGLRGLLQPGGTLAKLFSTTTG
jgi:hypothetical protein